MNNSSAITGRTNSLTKFVKYQKVLEIELPCVNALRARRPEHLPVVLAVEEGRAILEELGGIDRFMAELLYGTGMRVLE